MSYGSATANTANVVYPFAASLPAAVAAAGLADDISAGKTLLNSDADVAVAEWVGPNLVTFNLKREALETTIDNLDTALRYLGDEIGRSWAAARGQQDRINFARYVEYDTSQDGFLENVGEFFVGETDYGPPPDDPPAPTAGQYLATRSPMYANFA